MKSQHLHKKPSYHHKQIHVLYCDPREAELSKQEVEQLKKSVLYMRLFDTKSNFFYQWYNSASEQKTQDKQQFLYDFDRPEVNKVSKKVKIDKPSDQIKTVRGRIRTNKQIFNNCMTIQFNYDQEERELRQSEREKADMEQLLKMFK